MRYLYTDGSCVNNGREGARASWAVVDDDNLEVCGHVPAELAQTNQVAELYAIKMALEVIGEDQETIIISDSMYSINCLTKWCKKWTRNDWKTVKGEPVCNMDLIRDIVANLKDHISFEYYPSHTKKNVSSPRWRGNDKVDRIARSLLKE